MIHLTDLHHISAEH